MFAPQGYGTSGGGGSGGASSLDELIIDVSKNWNQKRIQNLGEPINPEDAVTKLYVDNKFTGNLYEILRYNPATDSLISSGGITITDDARMIFPCVSMSNKIVVNLKASSEGIDSGLAACRSTPMFSCGYDGHSMIGLVNNMIGQVSYDQMGSAIFLNSYHTNAIEIYTRGVNSSTWHRPLIIEGNAPDGALTIDYYGAVINGRLQVNGSLNISSGTFNIGGSPHRHDDLYVNLNTPIIYGELNANGFRINSLANPEIGTDGANKAYVDAFVMGLIWKLPIEGFATDEVAIETDPDLYDGARFVIISGATGEWASHINSIAQWEESTSSWIYQEPSSMWTVLCKADLKSYTYSTTDGWCEIGWSGIHSGLTGLDVDDHLQYLHITNPRIVTAIHTFSGSKPFNVSSTTLVNNLNAELLNGHSYADITRIVTSSYAGLCPTLPGDANYYLNGAGNWTPASAITTPGIWGQITGTIADQDDLIALLNEKLGINDTAYNTARLGGIPYYEYATIGDFSNAGKGLSETSENELDVNVDGRTIFINSNNELEVIGGDGDLNLFSLTPKVVANCAVGGVEPGYELSGKHIKTIIRNFVRANTVYPTATPYVFGFVDEFNPSNFAVLINTINETVSSKIVDYATTSDKDGLIAFGYPSSYGDLDSIELGTSVMSQDIIEEFDKVTTTLYGIQYTIYRHQNITDLTGISSYNIRFVTGVDV